jgi:hypothetical protein
MLRLTDEQYDQAVAAMAATLAMAEDLGLRTKSWRAMLMLEILGNDYDVAPERAPLSLIRDDLPLVNDETEAAIKAIWDNANDEVERANALFDWAQGNRP